MDDHKTMGFGAFLLPGSNCPNLTFHSVIFESSGQSNSTATEKQVFVSSGALPPTTAAVPAGTSMGAGTRWHGLPKMELLTAKFVKACISIPYTFIRTGINGKGFDSSTLLVT